MTYGMSVPRSGKLDDSLSLQSLSAQYLLLNLAARESNKYYSSGEYLKKSAKDKMSQLMYELILDRTSRSYFGSLEMAQLMTESM